MHMKICNEAKYVFHPKKKQETGHMMLCSIFPKKRYRAKYDNKNNNTPKIIKTFEKQRFRML